MTRDYEERRAQAYNTERLYVGLDESGVIDLRNERPYFPEHLYREAIRDYEDILNENPVRNPEKTVKTISTGDSRSKERL
ncbi:hypothetical protein ACM16X_02475 [Haloarcula japonica]|uniref:hypothetical protein n=1 Tax=Haloarcula japonica TaxID=29282 RepID=UPI0039F6D4C7